MRREATRTQRTNLKAVLITTAMKTWHEEDRMQCRGELRKKKDCPNHDPRHRLTEVDKVEMISQKKRQVGTETKMGNKGQRGKGETIRKVGERSLDACKYAR